MAGAWPTLPRICQARAHFLGPVAGRDGQLAAPWQAVVDNAADLGFAQLLATSPDPEMASQPWELLAEACARSGLSLYLDTSPARGNGLDRPDWLSDWTAQLAAWRRAGVAGFLFHEPQRLPRARLEELMAAVRADDGAAEPLALLAWTPGVSREAAHALRGAGYDAVFSSLAWWDFRSAWLMEEWHVLHEAGAVLAFPADPFARRDEEPDMRDAATRRLASVRALWASVSLGAGWLMPMGFESQGMGASSDSIIHLREEVRAANRWLAAQPADNVELRAIGGVDAEVAAVARISLSDHGTRTHVALFNASLERPAGVPWAAIRSRLPDGAQQVVRPALGGRSGARPSSLSLPDTLAADIPASLAPGQVRIVELDKAQPILLKTSRRRALGLARAAPRVAIESITPQVDGGRFAVKRTPGEAVRVQADVFMDGHDKLAVDLLWRAADTETWTRIPMRPLGNDRWEAVWMPERLGLSYYAIEGWRDTFATYRDELRKKVDAGLDVSLEIEEARAWAAKALDADGDGDGMGAEQLLQLPAPACLDWILSAASVERMKAADPREFASRSEPELPLRVERRAAQFSSWYELFPRSQGRYPGRHGTFDDVIGRLPAVRDMGFDVLYFPPIHPIGRKNRKGRNNSLLAHPEDPGSPYAIGSAEGGHDAIHPELGTLDDFRRLVAVAAEHGLEIALDFAIQCSPDHPWLAQHPDWFAWRADGSLRYAENPPKKYEDIVNVDFYARKPSGRDTASGLWLALLDVVLFWVEQGVKIFRVDNPHTKPLPFWEWMIAQVQARHPEVVFLAEAFTRPHMMYRLAKLGFSQSYTYFTWREHKGELSDYLEEISRPPVSDFFRPNFFVNTPDINPGFLQRSGRAGFLIRAALATTMAGAWGMYNGFEVCEATPVPGREEYLNSEKYEIRHWDWDQPGNIVAEITRLNRIRQDNPAFHVHTGIRFLPADNDQVLAYTKATPERDNVVLVVVSLDPFGPQGAHVELPLWEFGLPDDGTLHAEDLLHGYRFAWHGKMQYVHLEPGQPYSIWRISLRP